MSAEALGVIAQLTEEAVQIALGRAVSRIKALELSDASQVPKKTGLLRSSFDIGFTPRYIAMKWSALSPTGFDYAKIQDVGGMTGTGGYIAPKYYSDVMREQAREIVLEELVSALREMLGAS